MGLTQTELDTFRSDAIARITNGERTSMSGGAKSGSKAWQMSPQDILFEVKYAEQMAGSTPRAQKVAQVLNDQFSLTPSTT